MFPRCVTFALCLWMLLPFGSLLPDQFSNAAGAQEKPPPSGESSDETSMVSRKMSPEEQMEYHQLLRLFVDTLDQVERNYAKKVDRRELMEAAIDGLP